MVSQNHKNHCCKDAVHRAVYCYNVTPKDDVTSDTEIPCQIMGIDDILLHELQHE